MIGKVLSRYRIIELIGQGGMGEVYLAEDSLLDRKVALKLLPLEMEENELARKRFLREAKSAAALDHPYIAHIYEIGEAEGRSFIVMEYLKGETLQQKLEAGPLPFEQVLQLATEISEALDQAHRQGIVHRDLKPSNIMIVPGGHAKVMDFGLAKLLSDGAEGLRRESMTGLTGSGIRLGTVPYMSPEQLRGDEVDTRSDIFSFGVLLYEMVTGSNPFRRAGPIETANAILKEEPAPIARSDGYRSEAIEYVLRKMLAKEPERRYQAVLEITTDLSGLVCEVRGSATQASQLAGKGKFRRWLPAVIAVLVVSGAWPLFHFLGQNGSELPILRAEMTMSPGERLAHYYRPGLAIAPDGGRLAFVSGKVPNPYIFPEGPRIRVRQLDQWTSSPVPGTENSVQPFFSPDGLWLGFTQYDSEQNKWFLKKTRLEDGESFTICECQARWGASWGEDDRIYFGNPSGGLYRISAAGGQPEEITQPDRASGESGHILPHILPGAKGVLFTVPRSGEALSSAATVQAQEFATGRRARLVDGWDGRYVATGHLIFAAGGVLKAVPLNPERLELEGPEVPILEGVVQSLFTVNPVLRTGAAQFSVSPTGVLVYTAGSVFPEIKGTVVWVDRQGREESLGLEPRNYLTVRLSPDGESVLLTTIYPPQDVWVYDISRKTLRRQTFEGNSQYAVWGPGAERFTFSSDLSGTRALFTKELNSGPGEPKLLARREEGFYRPGFWMRDGKGLTVVTADAGKPFDIGMMTAEGAYEPILDTRFSEQYPEISPDGQWLVYTSDESGQHEVYVRRLDRPGGVVQISLKGGLEPAWAKDGSEIYYRWRREFFAVRLRYSEGRLTAARPVKLFEGDYASVYAVRSYDVARDGRLLLMKRPDESEFRTAIEAFFPDRFQLVQNWFPELRQRAPRD